MTVGSGDPVELYRARSLPEAHAIRLALESAGIAARIDKDLPQGALGEVPKGWSAAPRILVDRSDETVARVILEAIRHQMAMAGKVAGADASTLRCLACGVQMGRRVACPACGCSYEAKGETLPAANLSIEDDRPAALSPATSGVGESKPALLTPAEIVWEVAAVMAVGVVPHFVSAVLSLGSPILQQSLWRDAVSVTATSACIIFVTLYLIRRSGEPWARFGLSRPRFVDLMIAPALTFVMRFLWLLLSGIVSNADFPDDPVEVFRTPWDGALIVLRDAVSGFSEELVTRAYLITRLESLLRSRAKAVLIAAIVFSSYHAYQGLSGVVFALLFGLLFGTAYLVLRRVWPLALAHLLYNLLNDWW